MKRPQNIFKYAIGFVVCVLIRLFTRLVPLPNIEPVTSTMMPFGKKWGILAGAFFGIASIAIFDLITGAIGVWTIVTAAMFGIMGAISGIYLRHRKSTIGSYVGFSIAATLIYDFITGPIMSSVIFKMPFMVALVGQIPFTIWHLGGNIGFAALISPALYRWVITNKQLELNSILERFGQKAAA